MSAAASVAPAVSKGVARTQDGAPKAMVQGVWAALARIKRMPGSPSTLAISWGSDTMATVPCTVARRANSDGASMELSICTCASTKPGRM